MIHAIPEHATFRSGTVDRNIWHETIVDNCYRLPDWFAPGDQVLDLGAHTGSFSWRAANSGAHVLVVEASRQNYHLLMHNLLPLADRVLCLHAAVWRSDQPPCELSLQPNWIPANTGGGCVMGDAQTTGLSVLGIPLDHLLRLRDSWRLLKLDIEGAEFPVLYTSKELGRVQAIAAEYHHRHEALPFADAGPCQIYPLKAHLQAQGFTVDVQIKGEGMGLFFASR